jgi:uncharacterized membrane protein
MLWWLLTVAALAYAIRAWRHVRDLERREQERRVAFERLVARVATLEGGSRPVPPSEAPTAAPEAGPEPDIVPAAPAVLRERPAPVTPPSPVVPPPVAPAPPPLVPPPPVVPPPPRIEPAPAERPPSATPPPRPPAPPSAPVVDWEGLVGVKLFSWIAGVALVFAAVFFLRYSIDRGWLTAPIRMTIGLVVGIGLLVGCELRAARRYPVTANALDAAGIATLFATLFAAHALWDLVPQVPTFVAMAVVAAVAVALSLRRDSVFIALLGLLGGFATPALLSTGENRPIGLFGYLLLLNVGLAWIAYRRGWVILTVASVVLTTLYQWAWVFAYLDRSPLPLAMGIFLVFPIVHVGSLLVAGRERSEATPLFARMAVGAAVVPLLFGLYLAAVPAYGAHAGLLFGFVLTIGAGLALIAAVRGPVELHLIGALGTVLAYLVWCATSYDSAYWPGILGWVVLGVGLYLAAPVVAVRFGRSLDEAGAHGRVAASALLAVIVFLAWTEPAAASPGLLFGLLLALVAAIAAVAVATEDGTPHFVAAALALVAQAAWSARRLGPERLYEALGVYATFGLFFVAVPVVADRLGRRFTHERGTAIAIVASIAMVLFLAIGPVARLALGGIAFLLGTFVALLFLPVVAGPFPLLRLVGLALAWVVLAVWWAVAMTAALLLPALAVVGAMALLLAAGHGWLGGRGEARDPAMAFGAGLAVVAHGFLAYVVVRPELATPPWPWLGVLAVVDLAIAVGALAQRDGAAHLAAIVASQVVVLLWSLRAVETPWPLVALLAADGVALLAFGWIGFARRRGLSPDRFGAAAVAALLLAMLIAIRAAEAAGAPAIGWIATEHAVLLVALLAVAEITGWHRLRLLAAVSVSFASLLWVVGHVPPEPWGSGLVVAVVPFAVLLADAFRVDPRAEGALRAYQAVAVAGVVGLVLARHCIKEGDLEHVMGIVPVAQALALLLLLRRVAVAGRGERDRHLALVAATTLGFATAAIPLQLSLEHLTVALALEATALAWLYRRIGFLQLRLWIAGLAVVVFVRLTINPEVLTYHPRTGTPILNWYLYVYLVSAAGLAAAAALLRGTDDRVPGLAWRLSDLLPSAATALLFLLVNIEIADFYSTGPTLTFDFSSASLAQDLTYTLAWAVFAIGLLAAGIRIRSRGVRGTALGLLVVTILKCFVRDLWRLGGLYRVGSFVGLAICLSLVAVLLQRFVFLPKEESGT